MNNIATFFVFRVECSDRLVYGVSGWANPLVLFV